MRTRKLELGTRNLIGARVTQLRLARGMKQVELLAQLQLRGVDLRAFPRSPFWKDSAVRSLISSCTRLPRFSVSAPTSF